MADLDENDYAEDSGEGEDDQEDEFNRALGMSANKIDTWKDNLAKKNEVVKDLIKFFSSMVESHAKEYAIADHRGKYKAEDKIYTKLLDAPKFVTRAKRALLEHENPDQRHFGIFIAQKGWIKSILRPLLELCAKDDSILAMRCCSLALVLIRRISDNSQKIVTDATKGTKRKASSLDLQLNEDDREDDEKDKIGGNGDKDGGKDGKAGTGGADAEEKKKDKEREAQLARIDNVKQQLSALLTFKDALCSDKCNEAITHAFKQFWLKEQVQTSEDNKTGVAICFSYLRRILAIDAHPQWSSTGEIQLHRTVHDKYIVQLRILLSVIPGVCSDLLNAYHNDWLGDIILIIYFTLRGFEPKELHRVHRTGAIIQDFENQHMDAVDAGYGGAVEGVGAVPGPSLAEVVVPTALAASVKNSSAATAGKGRLAQALQRERNNSLAATVSLGGGSGVGRFRGIYQKSVAGSVALPAVSVSGGGNGSGSGSAGTSGDSGLDTILGLNTTTNTTSATTEDTTSGTTVVHLQTSKLIRDPFSTNVITAPTVQAKRNRKNLTFNVDDTLQEISSAHYATSATHQKASIVAASLANALSSELSLKPLVKRVNDDLRRDDMRVGHELELKYFDILYRVLHYNRLKIGDEYREYQNNMANLSAPANVGSTTKSAKDKPSWQPNLKNVMDALDRMSFMRVVTSIERLGKNPLNSDDIVVPLALFKEMVCYLRILLESELVGHHEIAVAALYRLYYASSERLDPLPRLLSAWKSGTYPKRHLHTLVELVHETLKTLDTAQVRFKADSPDDKKPRKKNKSEMDMEQYTMSCMRFSVDEYFKRYIVTNHSVRMYTKLLSHYARNDATVNYYVYTYLRRMNMYVLEQEHKAPMPLVSSSISVGGVSASVGGVSGVNSTLDSENEQVSLSFMLFNIHTLEVFSTILNDRDIYTNKAFEPLLRLIKSIVRRFGAAAHKNHMLFVELLFVHPRPHDFCTSIDSVYEASAYATYSNTSVFKNKKHTSNLDNNSINSSDSSSDSDVADYGDEFDENNLNAAFAADPKLAKDKTAKDKTNAKDKSKKRSRKESTLSDSDSDDNNSVGSVGSGNSKGSGGSGSGKGRKRERREKKKADKAERRTDAAGLKPHQQRLSERTSSRTTSGARGWTAEEDAVLAEQYALYAGSHSVFTSIAQCSELRALGRNRSEAQVSKRVTQLRLHMNITFSDSDGEKGSGSDEEGGEQETQEQRASQAPRKSTTTTTHTANKPRGHSEDFIMFSDHDEEEEGSERGSDRGSDMEVETQAQQAQSSPYNSGADDAAELADLFSPLPSTGGTSGGGGKGGSSNKKARVSGAVDSASLPRAVWDLDDDGPDLLEQRSLALMKSTGGASYGLSDDEDSLFGRSNTTANTKKKGTTTTTTTSTKTSNNTTTNTTSASTSTGNTSSAGGAKKGLSKSAARKPVTTIDSDDESLEFESSNTTSTNNASTSGAGTGGKGGDGGADKAAIYKKRLMRIDSDEDE